MPEYSHFAMIGRNYIYRLVLIAILIWNNTHNITDTRYPREWDFMADFGMYNNIFALSMRINGINTAEERTKSTKIAYLGSINRNNWI